MHIKVLNAAHYGSPQQRRRVIVWAAKLGHPLPAFPSPSHFLSRKDVMKLRISTIGDLLPASRSTQTDEVELHSCAPFPAVTVSDAISDLVCVFIQHFYY